MRQFSYILNFELKLHFSYNFFELSMSFLLHFFILHSGFKSPTLFKDQKSYISLTQGAHLLQLFYLKVHISYNYKLQFLFLLVLKCIRIVKGCVNKLADIALAELASFSQFYYNKKVFETDATE